MSRKRRRNTLQVGGETAEGHAVEAIDFDAAIDTFIRHCRVKNLSEESVKYYRRALTEFRKCCAKPRPMDVEKGDIEAAILDKRAQGVSDAGINSYLRGWRPFFRYLHEEGFIPENPAATVKLIKAERRIIQAFTKEEVRHLLSIPDRETFTGYRNYVIMLLMLDTGMRVSEVANLRLSNINWSDRTIVVFGKGRKERIIPFQRLCERHLKEYVKVRGPLEHDTLFVNLDNKPLAKRSIQDEIQKIGKISGIKGVRISPHTFRHTFAKFYIMNGGDVFSLQKLMGHTTLEMCQTYVSLFGTDIAKQHRKFSPLERLNDEINA